MGWSQLTYPTAQKDVQKDSYQVVGWTLLKFANAAKLHSMQLKTVFCGRQR